MNELKVEGRRSKVGAAPAPEGPPSTSPRPTFDLQLSTFNFYWMLPIALASMAALSGSISACSQSTEAPTLCVFTAAELAGGTPESFPCPTPAKVRADSEDAARCGPITAGDVYFIRHSLPAGIVPSEPLQLRIQTPCSESKLERQHVDGEVLVSRVASAAAECFLSVTATIENSELGCTSTTSPTIACGDLDAGCPQPDAGADSGP
jgi:hypothetical protein